LFGKIDGAHPKDNADPDVSHHDRAFLVIAQIDDCSKTGILGSASQAGGTSIWVPASSVQLNLVPFNPRSLEYMRQTSLP